MGFSRQGYLSAGEWFLWVFFLIEGRVPSTVFLLELEFGGDADHEQDQKYVGGSCKGRVI